MNRRGRSTHLYQPWKVGESFDDFCERQCQRVEAQGDRAIRRYLRRTKEFVTPPKVEFDVETRGLPQNASRRDDETDE